MREARVGSATRLMAGILRTLLLLGFLVLVGLATDDLGLGARGRHFFFRLGRRLFAVHGTVFASVTSVAPSGRS